MNTIKYIVICSFLLLTNINTFSQDNDRLKSNKVAFLTEKLDLTVNEAQVFWPLYNEYDGKLDKILTEKRTILSKVNKNQNSISQAEQTKLADRLTELEINEADLQKEYHEKFKTVLPIDKVLKYYKAETEFKKHILKELQKRNE